MQDGDNTKACCISPCRCIYSELIPPKELVFEVLIQNAHILFEEHPDPSLPILSSHVSDIGRTYGSLDQSPEFSRSAELQALSPLLGFPSSQTLMEDVETAEEDKGTQGAGGTEVVEVLSNNTPQDVQVNVLSPQAMPTSVAEWRLQVRQSGEHPQPGLTTPQSPPETVLSSTSDFSLSSATSLQTATGLFSL